MTVKYVTFGIIIDDIVFPDGRTQMGVLGGGGPQTAWGMALAAASADEVGLISGVGTDMDYAALAPLQAAGIDLSGVHVTDLPTPRAWQLLEQDGRRTHVWRIDQDTSDLQTHPDWETVTRFYPDLEVAHWGIHPEAPYLTICPPLRAHGVLISIEPFKGLEQPPPDDELRAVLTQCDIYSPTWTEAISLFGMEEKAALLAQCRALGGKILVLRHGAAGAEAWNLVEGTGVSVPAAPVQAVIDPVGAGDAFCGAFAVTWHRTADLAAAAISGAVAASYLVEQIGLPPALPATDDIQQRSQFVREGLQWHRFPPGESNGPA